jgi:hypothetical protein
VTELGQIVNRCCYGYKRLIGSVKCNFIAVGDTSLTIKNVNECGAEKFGHTYSICVSKRENYERSFNKRAKLLFRSM